MKNKKILAALAAAGVALSLAACGGGELTPTDPNPAPASEAAAPDAKPAPAPEPEKPAEPAGTVADPFPAGTALNSNDGTVSFIVNSVDWAAGPAVAAENEFNAVAPEGFTYVLANVSATNISSPEAVVPWASFTLTFVADDGRSFDSDFAVIPEALLDVGDLYPGGVGTGNVAFLLPNDVVTGGKWGVSYNWANPVFVSAH